MGAAFVEEQAEDYEEALRILREGFERLEKLGEHAYASTIAADSARALLLLGRTDEAEPWLAKARELCPPGDVATSATADFVDALLQARRGLLDDAERLVRRGAEQAESTDFWGLAARARRRSPKCSRCRGGATRRAPHSSRPRRATVEGATISAGRVTRLLAEL